MESDYKDTSATCQRCKQRPAATTYNGRNGKWSAHACSLCFDILEIRDTLEWGIADTFELEEQERYDEILAWLDAFEKANRHRDHDGWMAREITAHRAFTLAEAERYAESLVECEKREQLGFEDAWYRWNAGDAKSRALQGLGRHAEALAAFEEAFRHQDPRFMESARHLIKYLVELSENVGKPVDESWREVVQNIANDYEVEVPVRPTLGESILALFELTENMPSKRERELKKKQAAEAASS